MRKENKLRPVPPEIKLPTTPQDGTVKSIELPATASAKFHRTSTLVSGDITTEQDMVKFMFFMFNEPDVTVEYFSEYSEPFSPPLKAAIDRGDMFLLKSENYYYQHHRHDRAFILIPPSTMKTKNLPKWKRELVEKSPTFVKSTLSLSERKKREYEVCCEIEMGKAFRKDRQAAKYTYDVFLSYSERDRSIALPIRDELQMGRARVFMAQKSLNTGIDFAEEIKLSLYESEEVWVILSPDSLNSYWVTAEWGAAWVLGKKIVPILHRYDLSQIPARLSHLHCIDVARVGRLIKERLASIHNPWEWHK